MPNIGKLLFLLVLCAVAVAEPLNLAVASNFKTTLEQIAQAYTKQTGIAVHLSSASTGVLAAQILQGAPFDLLFAADTKTPSLLAKKLKLADPVTYAVGQLVFWCPLGAPGSEPELTNWQGKFALADSKHAPYGEAADSVVERLNWQTRNKKIKASNIAQVTHFVASGGVACGFIAKSLIPKTAKPTEQFPIPINWHKPIEQQALLLNSPQNKEAQAFLNYLLNVGKPYLTSAGYL